MTKLLAIDLKCSENQDQYGNQFHKTASFFRFVVCCRGLAGKRVSQEREQRRPVTVRL